MTITAITHDQDWLGIQFDDGVESRFFSAWLRDNTKSGRHRSGGQRTFDSNTSPAVRIAGARHEAGTVTVSFSPGELSETFTEGWLRHHCPKGPGAHATIPNSTLWGAVHRPPLSFEDFAGIADDPARLRDWLIRVRDFGFGLLENVPTTPGTVFAVAELFGHVRETNYGRGFEVRDEPDPANLAFTKLEIGMHTDNPYRDPVPGLQLLHCLINESDGGANQLCDGFAVAEALRGDHPEAFALLTEHAVQFRYLDEGSVDLRSSMPLIELDTGGRIRCVRYNSRSIQPVAVPAEVMADFYAAYRILGEAVHNTANRVEFTLDAGQLVLFDNERILHGRSAYNQGRRHLQGCYADKDGLLSRIRILEGRR